MIVSMTQEIWNAVDRYFEERLAPADEALAAALRESDAAGLPQIAVSPLQGKLLGLLARLVGARRILEIGTLGGYSTICLARALPAGGTLITLEYEPRHAAVARRNIARAGLADKVEVMVGAALDLAPKLVGPFDLVFIDADKENNPAYFEWALKLTKPGALILVDNVVRGGSVSDAATASSQALGVRRMMDLIAQERRVDATALQTVGVKGYDGLLFAQVIA